MTSTQTLSFPQHPFVNRDIGHADLFRSKSQRHILHHMAGTQTDSGRRPTPLVFPCEANPDLFRYLSLSSCGGTNCRLRKISSRLWLTFHDSSCCSDFQTFRRIMIACAKNNGCSGCFDTILCFPNSVVVSLANKFRTQSAQNPSEKHPACVKSPVFCAPATF